MRTIYSAMNRLSRVVGKALSLIAGLLIALCTAALLFQVLYRFVIVKIVSFSFPFTEEFARYTLIWSVYLCLGIGLREGSQVSVDIIHSRLKGKAKLYLYCLTRLFIAIFLVVAVYYGIKVVGNNSIFRSATLRIPGFYLFSAPVVGCLLMLYETITEMFGVLSGELSPFGGGAQAFDAGIFSDAKDGADGGSAEQRSDP